MAGTIEFVRSKSPEFILHKSTKLTVCRIYPGSSKLSLGLGYPLLNQAFRGLN